MEELQVLGVRQRIATFYEIDAQLIQPARDEQLVLQGKVDAFPLAAVSKGSVVNVDPRHKLLPALRLFPALTRPGAPLYEQKSPEASGFRAGTIRRCVLQSPALMLLPY